PLRTILQLTDTRVLTSKDREGTQERIRTRRRRADEQSCASAPPPDRDGRTAPRRRRTAAVGMTVVSARKLATNRANARASTGPRTAAGKAHSARNAVRHGLCSASWADPAISRAIEQVGRALAGEATGEERELAYAVAAAQVDLARAREAGRRLC